MHELSSPSCVYFIFWFFLWFLLLLTHTHNTFIHPNSTRVNILYNILQPPMKHNLSIIAKEANFELKMGLPSYVQHLMPHPIPQIMWCLNIPLSLTKFHVQLSYGKCYWFALLLSNDQIFYDSYTMVIIIIISLSLTVKFRIRLVNFCLIVYQLINLGLNPLAIIFRGTN